MYIQLKFDIYEEGFCEGCCGKCADCIEQHDKRADEEYDYYRDRQLFSNDSVATIF